MPEQGRDHRGSRLTSTTQQADFDLSLLVLSGLKRDNPGAGEKVPDDAPLICYHGSGSASLAGVLRAGLQPSGQLLRSRSVPFGGELEFGLVPDRGVNNHLVSAVWQERPEGAIEYALANLTEKAWQPARDQPNVIKSSKQEATLFSDPSQLPFEQLRQYIETERQRTWPTLSATEQQLIRNPFPVIYGVAPHEGFSWRMMEKGAVSLECAISPVQPCNLVVFVPASKCEMVREVAREFASLVRVEAFSRMPCFSNSWSSYKHKQALSHLKSLDASTLPQIRECLLSEQLPHRLVELLLCKVGHITREPNQRMEGLTLLRKLIGAQHDSQFLALLYLSEFGDRTDLNLMSEVVRKARTQGDFIPLDARASFIRSLWKLGGFWGKVEAVVQLAVNVGDLGELLGVLQTADDDRTKKLLRWDF
jgi:hypothetical protein